MLNTKGLVKWLHALIQSTFPAWCFVQSASDITNVRVTATVAANFNAGSIRIYAR
jgi:hypothetical protein